MAVVYAVYYGVLGLIIGSFLNVVVYRVPNGLSIVRPRSFCPKCGKTLSAAELIPVFSFLFLGRKCSRCKSPISWRYPAIELLTGTLFVTAFLVNPRKTPLELGFDFIFVSLLIALTLIDLDTMKLPDIPVIMLAGAGILNVLITRNIFIWQSIAGALGAGILFGIIAYLYPQGLGRGDVKFVIVLGIFLGSPAVFEAIFLASLFGVIFCVARILFYKKNYLDPIPFGPFLTAGSILIYFFYPGWQQLYSLLF